jgi:hypothetical protein
VDPVVVVPEPADVVPPDCGPPLSTLPLQP